MLLNNTYTEALLHFIRIMKHSSLIIVV